MNDSSAIPPQELPEDIQDALEEICDQGNEAMDEGNPEEALVFFRQALEILPPPAEDWEVYGWIQAAMGDAKFALHAYNEALEHFDRAAAYAGEDENPFVLMRIGQCYRRLKDEANAAEYLQRAFAIDGEDIFDEDPDDLAFLKRVNPVA